MCHYWHHRVTACPPAQKAENFSTNLELVPVELGGVSPWGISLSHQGMTITFFPTCPVGQVDESSACPSGKTSCPCQSLKISHFD